MTRWLAILAVATAAGCGLASSATAGTYDVYSCWAGAGSYLNPGASGIAWSADDSHATLGGGARYYRAYDDCGGAAGSLGTASLPGGAAPSGVYAESRFASPDGTRIERVRLWRAAYDYGTGTGSTAARGYLLDLADGSVFGRGDLFFGGANGAAGSGDKTAHGIVSGNYLDIDLSGVQPRDFSARIGCARQSCPTAGHYPGQASAPDTSSRIFGAIVTVRDDHEPSMVVAKTGLMSDGPHSGVQPVVVDLATDDSGIAQLAVYADANPAPVGLVDFRRDQSHCEWWKKHPCATAKDVSVPVDTRALGDGSHTLTVRAFDAAGNAHDHVGTGITVQNASGGGSGGGSSGGGGTSHGTGGGQPRGTSGGGRSTSGGGSRGSSGPDSSRGSAGLEEFFPSRHPLNGLHASERARMTVSFVRNGKARLRARYGSRPRIRGRLRNRHGHAIAFAEVIVQGRRPGSRSRWVDLGSAHTHKTGRFSFRLPRDANSLEIRVVYRAHLSSGEVSASRRLVVKVEWSVHLGVTPRSVRNGQAITFQGVLDAGRVRRSEKLVDMQVRIGRRWRTFGTTRAAADGTFAYRYRFRRTFRAVTYRFRALSRYEVGFPYSSGASRAVQVRVH